jgi:hypothetical protein
MALSSLQSEKISVYIQEYQDKPGALLPLMHAIQDDLGFVPEESYKPRLIIYRLQKFMASLPFTIILEHIYQGKIYYKFVEQSPAKQWAQKV